MYGVVKAMTGSRVCYGFIYRRFLVKLHDGIELSNH